MVHRRRVEAKPVLTVGTIENSSKDLGTSMFLVENDIRQAFYPVTFDGAADRGSVCNNWGRFPIDMREGQGCRQHCQFAGGYNGRDRFGQESYN
jgi:hypothetical protein